MFDLNPQFTNKPDQNLVRRKDRTNQNHANYRLETMEENSGVCSPPLWQSFSPPDSPIRFHNNPRLLSPTSRAQAIARGQREIMEMVENMPETSYELSLKDIVEQRRGMADETQSLDEGEERSILSGSQRLNKNRKGSVKRQESSKKGRMIVQNGSFNNNNKGLLINMFLPVSLGSKQRKTGTSSSFGNSPKPELLDKSSKYGGGDRRDGWWKRFTDSDISTSTSTSTGRSGSSGSSDSRASGASVPVDNIRKNKGCSHGCWSLFPYRKRKT